MQMYASFWQRVKTIHVVYFAAMLLGMLGCGKPAPARRAFRRCNLERIWIHALEDLDDMSSSDFDACNAACGDKDSASCVGAGLLLYEGRAVSKVETKARGLFERHCNAIETMGCIALSMSMLDTTAAIRGDALEEEHSLARMCDQGEIRACDVLGWFYRRRVMFLRREEDNEPAVKYSLAACNGGSRLGCTGVAWLQAYGFGVPKDEKKAADTFQKQCLTGHTPACEYLGNLYYSDDLVEEDLTKAADLYRSSCHAGVLGSCSALGDMLWHDYVPAQNGETAFGLFEKACQAGGASGCYGVALSYLEGKGVAQNLALALHYHEMACDAGSAYACDDLARMYRGDDVEENDAEVAVLFEKACWGGDPNACHWLGSTYADGMGLPKNAARSVKYFELACNGGRADGCYQSGRSYFNGVGVAQNQKKGAALLQKACDDHWMNACVYLSNLHRVGTGVPQNEGRAVELAKKACDNNDMLGCVLLGSLYASGSDAIKDAAKSVALYQKACNANIDAGYVSLGAAYMAGHGVKQDIKKGMAVLEKSCDQGSASGCFALGGSIWPTDPRKALERFDKACPTLPQACEAAKSLRSMGTP
jgi:TPR repeat protein